MATDVSVSEVWGTNAGFYAGDSIPSAITTSSNLFLIIPVSEAFAKANSGPIPYLASPLVELNFDSATDALILINSAACAYTQLSTTNNQKTTGNLRQFTVNDLGKKWTDSFESGKEHFYRRFDTYHFEENTTPVNSYSANTNTVS